MGARGLEYFVKWGSACALGVIAIVSSIFLYRLATGSSFTTDQWSAAGGWVGGIGAVVAVVVALYQSREARISADADRIESEQRIADERAAADERLARELQAAANRHAEQLAKSEQLLTNELDAQRRFEQIKTIPPIWEVIGRMSWPFNRYVQFLESRLPELVAKPDRDRFAAEVEATVGQWFELVSELELVFVPAQMTISEPVVYDAIKKLYRDTRELADLSNSEIQSVNQGIPADITKLREVHARIIAQRRTMTAVVRSRLTEGANPTASA